MAQTRTSYHKEVKTASFQGRTITVENLTPILAPKVRDKRKREIEMGLSVLSCHGFTPFPPAFFQKNKCKKRLLPFLHLIYYFTLTLAPKLSGSPTCL